MIPILADSYPYTGNGLGGLPDAVECVVSHEVNGIYELMMRYPITGLHFDELLINYFIMAVPDSVADAQPFRIYRITKPLNGIVTVYARHISYDMAGIIVEPFTAGTLTEAMQVLPNHCTPASPFTIQTRRAVSTGMTIEAPRPLWKLLGGQEGSFLDVYGGEWDFDGLTATLENELGSDRGVEVRYGKNMTDLEQDASLESTYSGVYPYWWDEESSTLVTLPEKYITIVGASVSDRIMLLDCSGDFEEAPTQQQLRDRANAYITANSVGSAQVSWKVSFVQLSKAGEYELQETLEQVRLGDTIKVKYETLGVDATSRAIKTEYDVMADNYRAVTIGRVKQNLAAIIVGQNAEMDAKIDKSKSDLERAIDNATDFIKNGGGYMRFVYDSANNLTEILSLDDPDINLAQNVWRWNNGGFGFSSNGVNGPYSLAMTQSGEIVADFITTGTLSANRVRAGLLTDRQNNNSWNLDTGELVTTSGTIGKFDITPTYLRTYNVQGDATTCVGIGASQAFWAGDSLSNQAPFRVSYKGDLVATSATITGEVNMTGGSVNIETNSETDDQIILRKGQYESMQAPRWHMVKRTATAAPGGYYFAQIDGVYGVVATGNGNTTVFDVNSSTGIVRIRDTAGEANGQLSSGGLRFFNASNSQIGYYPADGMDVADLNGCVAENVTTSGTQKVYTVPNGLYLIATARYNNTSTAQDGLWLASIYTAGNSHISTILNPSGNTTCSLTSAQAIAVSTGSANVRISVVKLV